MVVTEREVMDRLRQKLLFARYYAPAAIAVLGNPSIANSAWPTVLGAGLQRRRRERPHRCPQPGAGGSLDWGCPLPSVIKPVREVLCLPEEVTPLGLVYVGYPARRNPHAPSTTSAASLAAVRASQAPGQDQGR